MYIGILILAALLSGCAAQFSFQPYPGVSKKDAEVAFAQIQANEQALAQKIAELSKAQKGDALKELTAK